MPLSLSGFSPTILPCHAIESTESQQTLASPEVPRERRIKYPPESPVGVNPDVPGTNIKIRFRKNCLSIRALEIIITAVRSKLNISKAGKS